MHRTYIHGKLLAHGVVSGVSLVLPQTIPGYAFGPLLLTGLLTILVQAGLFRSLLLSGLLIFANQNYQHLLAVCMSWNWNLEYGVWNLEFALETWEIVMVFINTEWWF